MLTDYIIGRSTSLRNGKKMPLCRPKWLATNNFYIWSNPIERTGREGKIRRVCVSQKNLKEMMMVSGDNVPEKSESFLNPMFLKISNTFEDQFLQQDLLCLR